MTQTLIVIARALLLKSLKKSWMSCGMIQTPSPTCHQQLRVCFINEPTSTYSAWIWTPLQGNQISRRGIPWFVPIVESLSTKPLGLCKWCVLVHGALVTWPVYNVHITLNTLSCDSLIQDGEQLSKAISETPPKSLLLAPPICPTVDEIYQARLSTPPAEVCQYWGCSFCDHYNPVPELDSKEMPQDDMVDYLIQPPPCLGDDSEGINIIFCIGKHQWRVCSILQSSRCACSIKPRRCLRINGRDYSSEWGIQVERMREERCPAARAAVSLWWGLYPSTFFHHARQPPSVCSIGCGAANWIILKRESGYTDWHCDLQLGRNAYWRWDTGDCHCDRG